MKARVRNAALPLSKQHVFDLDVFPDEAARKIASLLGLVDIMRSYVDDAEGYARADDRFTAYMRVVAIASDVLPQLDRVFEILTPIANAKPDSDRLPKSG